MNLTANAISLINKPRVRVRLAMELDCSEQSVIRYINANQVNGELTKAAALKVIREETGLSDTEILEGLEVKEAQS